MVKVSVIMPTYNYGKYIGVAIDSVLKQTLGDFELIIVDDGSTDNTKEITKGCDDERIKIIINDERRGHIISSIGAIKQSSGEYIIRLDADDYFDHNALQIMVGFLDKNPDIALVYPDFFVVDEESNVMDYTRLRKLGRDINILDVPINGACTMFRRKCYDAVGGYNPNIKAQDGYDLWIKFMEKFKVDNINLPLFYYRKHQGSITTYTDRILDARREIKHAYTNMSKKLNILAIIPARRNDYAEYTCLRKLNGSHLIDYTIVEALKTKLIDKIIFTTEDEKIAEAASMHKGIEVMLRPENIARSLTPIEATVHHVLDRLNARNYNPDIVILLHVTSPFKKEKHITEAINTLLLFKVDSVISVCEDKDFHYRQGLDGLQPLFEKRLLRLERNALYNENGAVYISKKDAITKDNFLGKRIGHVIMNKQESIQVDDEYSFRLAEILMGERKNENK